jgi:hypothetical protein
LRSRRVNAHASLHHDIYAKNCMLIFTIRYILWYYF